MCPVQQPLLYDKNRYHQGKNKEEVNKRKQKHMTRTSHPGERCVGWTCAPARREMPAPSRRTTTTTTTTTAPNGWTKTRAHQLLARLLLLMLLPVRGLARCHAFGEKEKGSALVCAAPAAHMPLLPTTSSTTKPLLTLRPAPRQHATTPAWSRTCCTCTCTYTPVMQLRAVRGLVYTYTSYAQSTCPSYVKTRRTPSPMPNLCFAGDWPHRSPSGRFGRWLRARPLGPLLGDLRPGHSPLSPPPPSPLSLSSLVRPRDGSLFSRTFLPGLCYGLVSGLYIVYKTDSL